MNEHVSSIPLRARKTGLWTPWGAQRVPDPDRAAERLPKWSAGQRQEPVPAGEQDEKKPAA